MKEYNIRVTAVLPGAVFTDSWKGSKLPKERFMKPEDVAKQVVSIVRDHNTWISDVTINRPRSV